MVTSNSGQFMLETCRKGPSSALFVKCGGKLRYSPLAAACVSRY
jgi:hypothetical protein